MQKTIYYRNGVAVKLETIGEAGDLGCFLQSYELNGGKILFTNYADHS